MLEFRWSFLVGRSSLANDQGAATDDAAKKKADILKENV